jgi:hypothetical protein
MLLGNRSSQTMSAAAAPTVPPVVPPVLPPATHTPGGTLIPLPAVGAPAGSASAALTRLGQGTITTFGLPTGIQLPKLNGTNYAQWSSTLEAILVLTESEEIIYLDTNPDPASISADQWASLQRRGCAHLCLYIEPDVFSMVSSPVEYPTFMHKWDALKVLYSGIEGSSSVFNTWIGLVSAKFDDWQPMAPQLAKLNETRVALANAKWVSLRHNTHSSS